MTRPLRIEYPDAVYHITSRGNGRQDIFHDEQDYRKFLELLGKTLSRFNWICHAFCLMGNHYHLMIETPDANISRGMHHLNGSFSQAHHKRHDTVGHLFQGRFKAIVVDRESYLLELARYVVLNPVRAGLVAHPEDWPWSSYRNMAGLPFLEGTAAGAALPAMDWILGQFGPDHIAARQRYRDFVAAGIGRESPWRQLKSQLFLGKETFIENLKDAIPEKTTVREIPKRQRYANRPSMQEIFGFWRDKRQCDKRRRDDAIFTSKVTYGYDQKAIADFLGLHYTTVSRAIKRQEARVQGQMAKR